MSRLTDILSLFKWDATDTTDKITPFNIEKAMNENWDKIDEFAGDTNDTIATLRSESGHTIELSLDNTTYILTATLKNKTGEVLNTSTVDFPVESMIVNMTYDNQTKELVITLQGGTVRRVPLSDIVSGLVSQDDFDELEIEVNGLKEDVEQTKVDIESLQSENAKLKKELAYARANQITDTVSGEDVYLKDSAKDYLDLDIIGHSEQETTEGKNILSYIKREAGYSTTQRGITFTINNEDTIALNGTNTGGNSVLDLINNQNPLTLEAGTYYTIPTGENGLSIVGYDGQSYKNLSAKDQSSFTLNEEITFTTIYIQVSSGTTTTFTNKKVYPMISKTPITIADYEPYTGGQPAPSPIYPYPVKSCGENVNEFKLLEENVPAQTWFSTNEQTQISKIVQGTGVAPTAIPLDIDIKIGETVTITAYMLSGKYSTGMIDLGLYHDGNTTSWQGEINLPRGENLKNKVYSITTTITEEVNSFMPFIYGNPTIEEDIEFYIKVERGTQPTPYSPYGCGNVNEKISNKNLIDVPYTKENPLTVTGVVSSINLDIQANWVSNIIKAGDKIKLSCKAKTSSGTLTYSQLYLGNGTTTPYVDVKSRTITSQETTISNYGIMLNDIVDGKLRIVMYGGNTTPFTCWDFMLEKVESDTEVDYVPHEEQILSFPLAQGQKLMEGDYPADDEKVHHKWGEYTFTGDELLNLRFDYGDGTYCYSGDFIPNYKLSEDLRVICSHFLYGGTVWSVDVIRSKDLGIYFYYKEGLTSTSIYFKTTISTVEELKEALKNAIIQYELAEEETEDFTEEQQAVYDQIKEAYSYKGGTYISSPDEVKPRFEVTCVVDTKAYIDNKFNELSNAVVALGGV